MKMDKVEQQVNDVLRRYCWCDSPEEEFGVTLKEADLDPEAIQTVGDVYALMEKYRLSPA